MPHQWPIGPRKLPNWRRVEAERFPAGVDPVRRSDAHSRSKLERPGESHRMPANEPRFRADRHQLIDLVRVLWRQLDAIDTRRSRAYDVEKLPRVAHVTE